VNADNRTSTKLTALAALAGGGAGGFGGAVAAQFFVAAANRLGNADLWLKGPFGPPFFNVSLFVGVLYLGIALGLSRDYKALLLAFCGPFLGIVLPLTALSRWTWGAHALSQPLGWFPRLGLDKLPGWYYLVFVLYAASVWGTIFALGWRLGGKKRWLGGCAIVGGAFGMFVLSQILLRLAPFIGEWGGGPQSFFPPAPVLIDGLFTGAGMGFGLWCAARRYHEKTSGA
jgi:hypothetical protein